MLERLASLHYDLPRQRRSAAPRVRRADRGMACSPTLENSESVRRSAINSWCVRGALSSSRFSSGRRSEGQRGGRLWPPQQGKLTLLKTSLEERSGCPGLDRSSSWSLGTTAASITGQSSQAAVKASRN